MNIILPEKIDREEWLKLLRVRGDAGQRLDSRMAEAEEMLLREARPRGIYRVMNAADVPAEGVSIRKHLEGCERAAVLAVTIGIGIDQLISRAQITSMAAALVLDTGASVLMEHAADAAETAMKAELASSLPGVYTTPRFSPGYGDYPLECQREILTCVDAHRKIGIALTAGNMMVPAKSVTAVVGIADHPVTGRLASCGECLLRKECPFLKEGQHC